ncbi:hypothetical protein DAERI_050115 [Deinococcus aerius]|uniref:DUF805 domain-containing protein n=1 Tax=Deinococcus aerius TaxID=200253 RepID=A0A2I9D4M5_9DEIO|nr:DUF805 domain-containing protein [Deinococcus aerius]GBF05606.1 hypothetical protein DAERI_050115 [Deinococcus aerius]
MNEYLNVIRNHYADFRGRARRRDFWMFSLINTVVVILLELPLLLSSVGAAAAGQEDWNPGGLAMLSLVLTILYALFIFVPSLAVTIRRLHDTGRSGWWYLINFVPFVGGLVLFIFLVMESQPGANKWGPNPKGMEATAAPAW